MAEPVSKNWHQKMSEEADQAVSDMNDILDGPPIRDEDWGVIHAIANHSKKPKEEVAGLIRKMSVGQVFSEDLVSRVIFVKTPDNKLQSAQAYITRLERTLLRYLENEKKYVRDIEELRERNDELFYGTLPGQLSEFFRRFKEGFSNFLKWLGFAE